jgi:hypothetical protein
MTRVRARVVELAEAAEAPELILGLEQSSTPQLRAQEPLRSDTRNIAAAQASKGPTKRERQNRARRADLQPGHPKIETTGR